LKDQEIARFDKDIFRFQALDVLGKSDGDAIDGVYARAVDGDGALEEDGWGRCSAVSRSLGCVQGGHVGGIAGGCSAQLIAVCVHVILVVVL
jgi:hypothetical protein